MMPTTYAAAAPRVSNGRAIAIYVNETKNRKIATKDVMIASLYTFDETKANTQSGTISMTNPSAMITLTK